MSDNNSIKKSFIELGKFFSQFGPGKSEKSGDVLYNNDFYDDTQQLIKKAQEINPWFTEENVRKAFGYWARALTPEKVEKWLSKYDLENGKEPKKVGIVMAGNIPMVGLHDLLSVLASGNKAYIKLSSSDNFFLPLVVKYLETINPDLKGRVHLHKDVRMKDMDAVIATGSDNTARYFEYYFSGVPHIIRKNRNGVAVLTGEESGEELDGLADDFFTYFGLGCRNVSKIYIPRDYDLNKIFKHSLKYKHYINHRKYMNNFLFNKTVLAMTPDEKEKEGLLENGLMLLKNDYRYSSPIGVVHYERYDNLDDVLKILDHDRDKIQVVVSKPGLLENAVEFGKTQQPELWDYADNVDTMRFLEELNKNPSKKS